DMGIAWLLPPDDRTVVRFFFASRWSADRDRSGCHRHKCATTPERRAATVPRVFGARARGDRGDLAGTRSNDVCVVTLGPGGVGSRSFAAGDRPASVLPNRVIATLHHRWDVPPCP